MDLYAAACHAVDGRRRVRAVLTGTERDGDWWVLAIGKAASGMTLGALDALGTRVTRALVVTRADHCDVELAQHPQVRCVAGDHPVPGAASLEAGAAVLEFAAAAPAGQRVLVLVSGGASSLVEAPAPGIGLEELRALNEWGLASGLPIGALNAIRSRVSRLKAGRLAAALAHTRARALLISDVPDDDPAVVGSGLVYAPSAPPALPERLPEWVATLVARASSLPPGARLPVALVGTLEDALAAAERTAAARGFTTKRLAGRVEGDVVRAANHFAHEFAICGEDVLIWGGEPTVELPAQPGRGGRNQQLALAIARLIRGHHDLVMLVAGTDGTDGNTGDAGAIVDGETLERGRAAGHDAGAALEAADAGTYLESTGDLLHTGPTGTNVGDVLIALRRNAPSVEDTASVHALAGTE
jgi:hydroxypyruvate reductase